METAIVLLTGRPGSGKTTAIRKIIARLKTEAGGFFTEEVRRGGRRVGFRILTLEGQEGVLAHVEREGIPRVGKYGVDLETLDEVGVASIREAIAGKDLIVIDEIGPMELLSEGFREVVLRALESGKPVLGSIMQRRSLFADAIKAREEVRVIEIRRDNREAVVEEVLKLLQSEV